MSSLPQDLITEILVRLPPKILVRFLCVSKGWYAVIKNPKFIKMHLQLSIATNRERTLIVRDCDTENYLSVRFNDDDRFHRGPVNVPHPLGDTKIPTQIVGYCNGIVCIHNCRSIVIWNPILRRYRKLPGHFIYHYHLAFGHDEVNDDYKVMRVENNGLEAHLYSLKAHSWKRLEEECPKKCIVSGLASLNGAFHWLVAPLGCCSYPETLVAFDLATEKFWEFDIPVQSNEVDDSNLVMEVLNGYICVCVNVGVTRNDFWVMEEYGEVNSWTRVYTIEQAAVAWDTFELCRPLVYSKDGKKVLMQQDLKKLFWYNIDENRGSRVWIPGMPRSIETAICVGSLVLLDGDSVIDPRQTKRNNERKRIFTSLHIRELFH